MIIHHTADKAGSLDGKLLTAAQWMTILIPFACATSRFVADLLMILCAILFLAHAAISRETKWLHCRWLQVALALWILVMIRSLWAEDVASALGRSASWIRFPIFAAGLAFWILRDSITQTRFILGLSITVGFMLCDTALQYFTGTDILGFDSIPSAGSPRLTGPFSSPRVGIMLVWMTLPAAAYWLIATGTGLHKEWSLALGLAMSIGLLVVVFMSGERMALLLTGFGFLIGFFILPIRKWILAAAGAVALLLMALIAYENPGLVIRQMDSTKQVVGEFEGSDYGRIWQSGWEIVKDYPLLGAGMRQFREVCPSAKYGSTETEILASRCNQHPHNIYLEWLSEAGLVGLWLFLVMVGLILREAALAYPALKTHPVFLGLLITLLIRFWPIASSTSFFTAWSAVPLWLFIGWIPTLTRSYQKDTQ